MYLRSRQLGITCDIETMSGIYAARLQVPMQYRCPFTLLGPFTTVHRTCIIDS